MIQVREDILSLKEEIIALRRKIHAYPEVGFKEFMTSQAIKEYFNALGVTGIVEAAGTGVIVNIEGREGQRCYAFRADMDAISVEEKTGLEFASREKGIMHACGHDAHTAILAGFGRYLVRNRYRLLHSVKLIFQPAEEGPGGALPLIEEGVLENPKVDGVIGLHLFPDVQEGKVGVRPGPMMAQTGEVYIEIAGESSHGAQPQRGKDALVAACNIVVALQTVISREVDPLEPAVLTLGRIKAGERQNVVAGRAFIEGTIRAFSGEIYRQIKERINHISTGISNAFGCRSSVKFVDMYPSVNNDGKLFNYLVDALGEENVDIITPVMLAEDFSYYQQRVPGLFFMLGIRNEEEGFIHPLHSSYFNFNEGIMLTGIEVYVRLLEKLGGFTAS